MELIFTPRHDCNAAISRGRSPLSPFDAYLVGFARGPCHSALWSVAGSVKMWVKTTSFLL
jgi:hypothetical protein